MAEEKIAPEEKLLKLIKGEKKDAENKEKLPPPVKNINAKQAKEAVASNGWFEFLDRSGWLGRIEKISLINRVLTIIVVIVLGYLIYEFIFAEPEKIEIESSAAVEKSETKSEEQLAQMSEYSHYSSKIGTRDLFKPLEIQEAEKQQTTTAFAELVKNLALIGIISGPSPQAIIEDKAAQKTYFLNEKDRIGDVIIKKIGENSVTLSYQEEETELRL